MITPTDYSINWYSRLVTESSGTSPSWQYLLCHADKINVSSGTVFVDHSSYNNTVLTRGSAIIQDGTSAYFGIGGMFLSGSTATVDTAYLAWNFPTILVTTATPSIPAFQVEQFVNFTSLNSAGMYLWELSNLGHTDYGQCYIYQTGTAWRLVVHFFRSAVGQFFSHEYPLTSFQTGSWNHFAMVRVRTDGPGSNRIGLFHNGSQLAPVSGGFPTGGSGDWRNCTFANPQGDRFLWGGSVVSNANGYNNLSGRMDEMRVLYDSIDGLAFDTALSIYYFNIPTTAYTPISGTFVENNKLLSLSSSSLFCSTDGGLALGQSGSGWGSLWVSGTGKTFIRSSTTYMWSSAVGSLTLVAGTQIDLQANIVVTDKNFVFSTGTGVKMATATNQKLAFWNATPVVQPTAISAAVGTITFTEPTVADYAVQDLTTTSPYGFVTADEGQTVLKVLANVQSRLGEVITVLKNIGILP